MAWLDNHLSSDKNCDLLKSLPMHNLEVKVSIPSIIQPLELELKPLPSHLRYAFLRHSNTLPIITSASLTPLQEEKLLRILRDHKLSIGWNIANIRGIGPNMCMHKILLEEGYKPSIKQQRCLNLIITEVVKKEMLKWLDARIIFLITHSS